MRIRPLVSIAIAATLCSLPAMSEGEAPSGSVDEVIDCLETNIPEKTSQQTVEFTAVDRIGSETVSRAKILGKRFEDGLRRILLRFTKPLELRGAAFLVIEVEGRTNDMFLYTPEMGKVKRITAEGAGGNLFGTDFSYEDFQRWQGLNQPGHRERLENDLVEGRAVFVLATWPASETGSSYESVVSYVDQDTCVVLKSESFEKGHRLRKVLTVDPNSILREAGIHVASEVLMRDLRDETHTRVVVEEVEVDQEIKDREFQPSRLIRRR